MSKNKVTCLSELLDYESREWRREHLINQHYGQCPDPDCQVPKDPIKDWKYNYRVVHVDSWSWAVCDVHKVRWNLGVLNLGLERVDYDATRALRDRDPAAK